MKEPWPGFEDRDDVLWRDGVISQVVNIAVGFVVPKKRLDFNVSRFTNHTTHYERSV
jgi:hypothetical protein